MIGKFPAWQEKRFSAGSVNRFELAKLYDTATHGRLTSSDGASTIAANLLLRECR
jgi:hypothetical protein